MMPTKEIELVKLNNDKEPQRGGNTRGKTETWSIKNSF